jgi:UDPglucose--hexose-1-phosphate uridylyltransferase
MTERIAKIEIEKLLKFSEQQKLLDPLDVIPARNALLDLFRLDQPFEGELNEEVFDSAVPILERLLDYAASEGLIEDNTVTHRDLFDARIMGLLMPRASEVSKQFWNTVEKQSIKAATDEYYKLSIDSNYIRMDRILKNKHWLTSTEYGSLEITINLSKPEKDPKDIAAERSLPQSNYPQCLLCEENVGYAGRLNHPARQNHRIIPLKLTGEDWFLQYSPYVYYNEHSIVFKKEHVPMRIHHKTFDRLLSFAEQFSHYFIGSNADLPIVGGSILNHDHFQSGKHAFPMELADVDQSFNHNKYPHVKAGIVAWPMSVIRLSSNHKEELLSAANDILDKWRAYSDSKAHIEAFSEMDGENVPHNTITPIARNNAAGELELDLVLRNNRTTEDRPHGLYHPRESLHHIKKENIGLIEVMGLAILPGRLLHEMDEIVKIISGNKEFTSAIQSNEEHSLYKHSKWIAELIQQYGNDKKTEDEAVEIVRREVGLKFLQVLLDAGVYKRDAEGQAAFKRFMRHLDFNPY